jgi:hypothetical protein
MAIWKFKAKCLSLLDEVHKTIKAILVTRFGKPVGKVIPPSAEVVSGTWIGSMKDLMKILRDFVSPASDENDWEALRG